MQVHQNSFDFILLLSERYKRVNPNVCALQGWKLWNENNIGAFIDPVISEPCFQSGIIRCMGLLCAQEFVKDRPSMSTVISMLRCRVLWTEPNQMFCQQCYCYSNWSPLAYRILTCVVFFLLFFLLITVVELSKHWVDEFYIAIVIILNWRTFVIGKI